VEIKCFWWLFATRVICIEGDSFLKQVYAHFVNSSAFFEAVILGQSHFVDIIPPDAEAIILNNCDAEAIILAKYDAEAIILAKCDAEAIILAKCDAEAIILAKCDAEAIKNPRNFRLQK
jgi:hypothetical protein